MEKKRDLSLDYAKGLAMLSIIIGHLYFYTNRFDGSLVGTICDVIQIPVFMYISGLLAHISIDRYGFRKLIVSKVIRLLFPFVSFCIIWCIIDPSKYHRFLFSEFKYGYWFLPVLFELMVILSFVRRVQTKFKIPSYITNGVIYALITLYLMLVPRGNLFNTMFSINLLWHYYPFFMLGYYYYRIIRFMSLSYAPVYLVVFIVALYFCFNGGPKALEAVCNISSLMFIVTMLNNNIMPGKKLFTPVGEASMQVYMVHFFLLMPLVKVLPIVSNRWLEFPYYAAIAICIIVVTIFISRLLMKSSWLAMILFGIRRK